MMDDRSIFVMSFEINITPKGPMLSSGVNPNFEDRGKLGCIVNAGHKAMEDLGKVIMKDIGDEILNEVSVQKEAEAVPVKCSSKITRVK